MFAIETLDFLIDNVTIYYRQALCLFCDGAGRPYGKWFHAVVLYFAYIKKIDGVRYCVDFGRKNRRNIPIY